MLLTIHIFFANELFIFISHCLTSASDSPLALDLADLEAHMAWLQREVAEVASSLTVRQLLWNSLLDSSANFAHVLSSPLMELSLETLSGQIGRFGENINRLIKGITLCSNRFVRLKGRVGAGGDGTDRIGSDREVGGVGRSGADRVEKWGGAVQVGAGWDGEGRGRVGRVELDLFSIDFS